MKNAVKLRVGNQNYLIGYFNAFMNSGPPEFGRSVNPFQTMGGGGLIMPITLLPIPRIQNAIYTSAFRISFRLSKYEIYK